MFKINDLILIHLKCPPNCLFVFFALIAGLLLIFCQNNLEFFQKRRHFLAELLAVFFGDTL